LGGVVLGQIYKASEKYSEAIALTEGSLQTDPTSQFMLQISGYAYAMSGRRHEAEETIKRFQEIEKTQYAMSYYVATIYAALGEKDKAFSELEKAFEAHDWDLHRLKVDPAVAPLRDDPRFKDLLHSTRLE
jgi:adenylate cyclase